MILDSASQHAIDYQRRRRAHSLGLTPPDRQEAEKCMQRIDNIIDRRLAATRRHSVAPDGEIVFDDQSSWVKAQTLVVNETTEPEPVYSQEDLVGRFGGGGTAVLDRDEQKKLPPISQSDVEKAVQELGLDPSPGDA